MKFFLIKKNQFAEIRINREIENSVVDREIDSPRKMGYTSKEEKVLFNTEAIERYLLETQFNVDFSKIDNNKR